MTNPLATPGMYKWDIAKANLIIRCLKRSHNSRAIDVALYLEGIKEDIIRGKYKKLPKDLFPWKVEIIIEAINLELSRKEVHTFRKEDYTIVLKDIRDKYIKQLERLDATT